ncbi:hypothetical protein [Leifsonia sp. P73]|uniref:hypothetical protein n=1 Tax=Leifsonia sp. P73 TaxID=3423959 RepID=UPI003DA60314
MNNVTKRVGIRGGAAVVASGLIVGGLALPANAETSNNTDTAPTTTTAVAPHTLDYLSVSDILHSVSAPVTVGPVVQGPVASGNASGNTVGPVASGDPVASGNQANGNSVGSNDSTPVASGNNAPVGSGNDTSAGNGTRVSAPVRSGDTTGASLSNLGASVTDSVNSAVSDALKGLNGTSGVLGR